MPMARMTDDTQLLLARGYYADVNRRWKFGFNNDVGATEETLWSKGAGYVWQENASTLVISSSSTEDSEAGTGARTVRLHGLDANYDEIEEDVTLDGQSGVTTTNSFLRINRMKVLTAGTGEENASDLYASTGNLSTDGAPAGNVYAFIDAGENQTLMALWTVPAGHKAYLRDVFITSAGNANAVVTARLKARELNSVFRVLDKFKAHRDGGPVQISHHWPVAFPEKTDIEMTAEATGAADVSAGLDMVYIKEPS